MCIRDRCNKECCEFVYYVSLYLWWCLSKPKNTDFDKQNVIGFVLIMRATLASHLHLRNLKVANVRCISLKYQTKHFSNSFFFIPALFISLERQTTILDLTNISSPSICKWQDFSFCYSYYLFQFLCFWKCCRFLLMVGNH